MADIVIHHHLGLGDHIDCNGMVRYFAELYEGDTIHSFAKTQYFDMIEWMYRDDDQIKVHCIEGNEYSGVYQFMTENNLTSEDLYIVGHGNYPTNPSSDKNCWEYFYEQLDIDLDIMLSQTKMKRREYLINLILLERTTYLFMMILPEGLRLPWKMI